MYQVGREECLLFPARSSSSRKIISDLIQLDSITTRETTTVTVSSSISSTQNLSSSKRLKTGKLTLVLHSHCGWPYCLIFVFSETEPCSITTFIDPDASHVNQHQCLEQLYPCIVKYSPPFNLPFSDHLFCMNTSLLIVSFIRFFLSAFLFMMYLITLAITELEYKK
jgi:hypothetical protein